MNLYNHCHLRPLTYGTYLYLYLLYLFRFNNYSPDLSRDTIRSAIERALGLWADVTPLTFSRQSDGTDATSETNIEVLFGFPTHTNNQFDPAFDGPSQQGGTVLAHAFNPGSVLYNDIRGDIHFDEDEIWQDAGECFTHILQANI